MKIVSHPDLQKEYSLNENTQFLSNKMAVLLKENSIVYRITPWMFCREFINDVVVSLINGKSCKIYGLETIPILYNKDIHSLGFSINKIKNKNEFIDIILQIPELIGDIAKMGLGLECHTNKDTVNVLFYNLDIKKVALISFISYLFKLAVYFSNEKQEVDITTFNKYSKLDQTLFRYPESFYYQNSIKYNKDIFKQMVEYSLVEDKKEWSSVMHSSLGFITSLLYASYPSKKHPFLC